MDYLETTFVISAHRLDQLPTDELPEIAFAGRSNVGKSSLLNTLLNRKQLAKVSSRPGKTTGLNFFLVQQSLYFVDLPGYGYAKVGKEQRFSWGKLISAYLETRKQLAGVVVIMDLRHGVKQLDSELLHWLRRQSIPFLAVYTKADKLSGNERTRQAALLDAGHGISSADRVVFSSVNRLGRELLLEKIQKLGEGSRAS
ncbi:ribosome biogenesis GTP-binding protein YihA/YsxC [Desulfofustis limnaeus]|jgi:GTP-binding protein|uniref:Probable GTP-binding protein EngB n=1 Tax=Desulfofustis limnaeus TaxID=2740163 RepID=A0ABM7W8P3_9BACT|nr:ribosome biogenesis GTP-binding protein YihA/YsxC [Desulfofustis limnaeus]MDX9894221.1 ribosome biogenesis GTP-binding protein YihA/YsxC [Desulfofustis sp.]BDD87305.1 putative GTP-binding protein EngB [Desulfofustis limnaeus]